MALTYRNLSKIAFPIYLLDSDDYSIVDSLVFIEGKVVDDRNMPGETLGIRRLQTSMQNLYPLNKSIANIAGLLKRPGNKHYIDTKGRIFTYEKTLYAKIVSKRIKKVVVKEKLGAVIHIESIPETFPVARPPEQDLVWASIIYIGNFPWLVYEFSAEKQKDRRLKI